MTAFRTTHDASRIAEDAYVFAYPLVAGAIARPASVPFNRLVRGPGGGDSLAIRGWLDLAAGPVVLSTPDTSGRYYSVWMRDAWNAAFASVGARTTGTGKQTFAIYGPGWDGAPSLHGMTPIMAPTRFACLGGAIEAMSESGAPGCEQFLEGFDLTPLSRWSPVAGGQLPPPGPAVRRTAAIVDGMDARSFFSAACRLIGDNPADPRDPLALTRLQALQLSTRLEPRLRAAVEEGVANGRAAVHAEYERARGDPVRGWRVGLDLGGAMDRLRQAAAVYTGLGRAPATDELSAVVEVDADGRPLSGRHRYVLEFAPDAVPPVSGFWSLATRPDAEDGANGAYRTGDLRGLMLDRDGALAISIQRATPAHVHRVNWLPAPRGRFSATLRMHWPRPEAVCGKWSPPAVLCAL